MLRRSIFELLTRGSIRRIPRQIPAYLSSRKEFSSASLQNASQGPGSKGNPLESDNKLSKFDVASVIVGGSILMAHSLGYLDLLGKEQDSRLKSNKIGINNFEDLNYARCLGGPVVLPNGDEHNRLSPDVPLDEQKSSTRADVMHMAAPVSKMNDAYISGDGKLVLDFLQAIHAAEKRQAELDAHVFAEEKKMLKEKYEKELEDAMARQLMYAEEAVILNKVTEIFIIEKYEKELKDARARQLMYAEEAAILDKELNKERAKAAAAIKLLQEKAEDKHKMELERTENEAELVLKKIQELAKAELAAAIASEKTSQIEATSHRDERHVKSSSCRNK